jgi:hypothetical protein
MCWSLVSVLVLRTLFGAWALGVAAPGGELPGKLPGNDAVCVDAQVQASEPSAPAPPAPAPRLEWFEVRRGDDPTSEPVAVGRLLRVDAADYTLLERDVVWREEGWRVHQTERLAGRTRRFTWREQGPRGALAWTADWDLQDPSGGREATIIGYGWARPTHERARAKAPWIGALEWLEAARGGATAELGPVAWLAPMRASQGAARPALDGSAAGPEGRATFVDGALVSFELGSRDLRATLVTEVEYLRAAERWGWRSTGRHPFVEAALRKDQTLRRLAELGPSAVLTRH